MLCAVRCRTGMRSGETGPKINLVSIVIPSCRLKAACSQYVCGLLRSCL